jgi:26S proteasome regulatory subunit N2
LDDDLLRWTFESLAVGRSFSLEYKKEVLHLLLELFRKSPTPDYFTLVQIHIQLNEPSLSSELIQSLLSPSSKEESAKEKERRLLIAYQVGFDLAEGATQEFLGEVSKNVLGETEVSSHPLLLTHMYVLP